TGGLTAGCGFAGGLTGRPGTVRVRGGWVPAPPVRGGSGDGGAGTRSGDGRGVGGALSFSVSSGPPRRSTHTPPAPRPSTASAAATMIHRVLLRPVGARSGAGVPGPRSAGGLSHDGRCTCTVASEGGAPVLPGTGARTGAGTGAGAGAGA